MRSAIALLFPGASSWQTGEAEQIAPRGGRPHATACAQRGVTDFAAGFRGTTLLLASGHVLMASGAKSGCVPMAPAISLAADATGTLFAATRDGSVVTWEVGAKPSPVAGLKDIVRVVASTGIQGAAAGVDRSGHVRVWSVNPEVPLPPQKVSTIDGLVDIDFDVAGIGLKKDGSAWVFFPEVRSGKQDPLLKWNSVQQAEDIPVPSESVSCPESK